jgi:hypothetical protein
MTNEQFNQATEQIDHADQFLEMAIQAMGEP